ncbi:hypothetical protein SIO70_00850 [Chitinophaga sancti]|uniref:hypothetical protein n=1 Tax=Chitinophaga sancti TaxID=1004 RepID=UPI002A76443C|nr:hypothetical protein [Chitinophaga sancti]WPQ63410.1 hypothetical protein SIO70_00850 [Chitinophaga sancti]
MENKISKKIVVIHDGLISNEDPLLVVLRGKFGIDNVLYFKKSDDGLDYVLNNLHQPIVVILDMNFSRNEKSGIEVFQEIREKSALVYIILITANEISKINNDDLISLINNDAFAVESVSAGYTKIVSLVESAAHKLDTRVDSALENWIVLHPESEKNKPYIMTRDGQSYSLNQLLTEIRKQTLLGMEIEKDILMLVIDMLSRGKKSING